MKLFNTKLIMILFILAVAGAFISNGIYAGTEVKDEIKMENPAYKKHSKGIVTFTHKKHNEEYKLGCGECHHDKDNKPLNDLKMGDDVKNCIECHKIAGKAKSTKDKKLTDKEKREYQADAIHDNCVDCHKEFGKKNPDKKDAAPTKCNDCHPKDK